MNIDPRLDKQVSSHPYPLVFVTISGAHLYGFPSPDSDYDLRGVHLLPLPEVVGLKTAEETVERSGIHDGLEIDLVTHDAKKFFGLMLKKYGYVLEQGFSPLVVHTTPEHTALSTIRKTCVLRRLPSGETTGALEPKSTWASSPGAHSIRRNGSGRAWPRRRTYRRKLS